MDVAWSPTCSSVLASVAQDGRIELWDLEESYLDPVVRIFYTGNDTSSSRTHQVIHRKQPSNSRHLEDPMLVTPHSFDSSNENNCNMDDIDLQTSKVAAAVHILAAEEENGGQTHKTAATIESLSEAIALTTIAFSTTVPVLAVGTSEGDVLVYKIGVVDR